jgi:hypothetical protein
LQTGNVGPLLEQVLKIQQEIQLTLAIHTNMLNALMHQSTGASCEQQQIPMGLTNIKDLDSFNRLINMLESDDVSKTLVSELAIVQ